MSTFSLQLLEFPGNYESNLPDVPRAYIAIKTCSEVKCRDKAGKKEINFRVISTECLTINEFHDEVERLINELETLKKQADKFFHREVTKRSSMSSKGGT